MKQLDFRLKRFFFRFSFIRRLTYLYQVSRLRTLLPRLLPHLQEHHCKTILDLGPNTCVLAELLTEKGFEVSGLDVSNWSVSSIQPTLYDGSNFPFAEKSFDFGLAISMLHHTKNPELLLSELKRTCKFILLQEDLTTSHLRSFWTWTLDSIVNLEIWEHPHSNKSDSEWKKLFESMDLEPIYQSYYRWQLVQFGIYLLRT